MAAQQDEARGNGTAMKRRGILAAAAAVMAGVAAKGAAQPVAAATSMQIANTETGEVTNPVVGSNLIRATSGFTGSQTGVLVVDARGATGNVDGIRGFGAGTYSGLAGFGGPTSGPGVYGQGTGNNGAGVVGVVAGGSIGPTVGAGVIGAGTAQAYGVYGFSDLTAIRGESSKGGGVGGQTFAAANTGVSGVTGAALNAGTYGVAGSNAGGVGVYGTSATSIGVFAEGQLDGAQGVYGFAQGANGTGTTGYAPKGIGVLGVTNASNQYGVLGTTTAANSTAIAGIANASGSSAFSGGTTNSAAFAGVFQGTVVVQGKLVVSDPSYKSGALAHPDGSHRLVYCVESPESWIEDVGAGQLTGGKATVTFDKDFAAVTHTDEYHVFLTPYGDSKGLYVTNKTAAGFEVREQGGGTGSLGFSWKVMVKGKSNVKSERLGKFAMPNLPLPDPSKFKTPEITPLAVPKKP